MSLMFAFKNTHVPAHRSSFWTWGRQDAAVFTNYGVVFSFSSVSPAQVESDLSVSSHCLLVCVSFYSSVVSSTQDGGMAIE